LISRQKNNSTEIRIYRPLILSNNRKTKTSRQETFFFDLLEYLYKKRKIVTAVNFADYFY